MCGRFLFTYVIAINMNAFQFLNIFEYLGNLHKNIQVISKLFHNLSTN
jgi:hypothetical protein